MTSEWHIDTTPFGTTGRGEPVTRFDLVAPDGSGVALLDYGATVLEVRVPDRAGGLRNVALGHRDLGAYETNPEYLGVTVGRTAGRRPARPVDVGGATVHLPANEGDGVHLHGGPVGFHRRLWNAEVRREPGQDGLAEVTFARVSDDGEDGYPGRLEVRVHVAWTERHELRIRTEGASDRTTLFAPTHHGTWNLEGAGAGPATEHELSVDADAYLALDDLGVATGEVRPVRGTPLDLRDGTPVATLVPGDGPLRGRRLDVAATGDGEARAAAEFLRRTHGLDAAFVLPPTESGVLRPVATLHAPRSGITMTVITDEPALQAYAGSFLGRDVPGTHGTPHVPYGGVALEPQRFPGPAFHDHPFGAVLVHGEGYRSENVFRFGKD